MKKCSFLRTHKDGIRLSVHVQPKSSRTEICGEHGERLKIKSPPSDGKANAELLRYLAEIFDPPRSSIVLLSGKSSRQKALYIPQISIKEALSFLPSDLQN